MSKHFVIVVIIVFASSFYAMAEDSIVQQVKTESKPLSEGIFNKANQEFLSKYKEQAENYRNKNLNRFGISELQRYDAASDSLYKKELNDTLASFKINYDKLNESRNVSLSSLNAQIKQLSNQREEAQTRYHKLLRKAIIASVAWLVIIFILMQLRSQTLKRAESRLSDSKIQLQTSQQNFEKGNELFQFARTLQEKTQQVTKKDSEIQKEVSERLPSFDLSIPKDQMTQIQSKFKSIHASASLNGKLLHVILSQSEGPLLEQKEMEGDKVATNLNQLCDECMDAVYYGVRDRNSETTEVQKDHPASSISIAKDLEKNLPSVKVIPNAVNYLLLNVLSNAFQSVNEKSRKNIKSYAPKVSISTRVLPRFVQIRVKDNGNGMTDEMINHAYQPFYSAWEMNESSGLGMYFSRKIITELHKGEMKIESQVGNGTDVYLKFYVL